MCHSTYDDDDDDVSFSLNLALLNGMFADTDSQGLQLHNVLEDSQKNKEKSFDYDCYWMLRSSLENNERVILFLTEMMMMMMIWFTFYLSLSLSNNQTSKITVLEKKCFISTFNEGDTG